MLPSAALHIVLRLICMEMLCEVCNAIEFTPSAGSNVASLESAEDGRQLGRNIKLWYRHRKLGPDLASSIASGCHLCALIRK